MDCMQVVVVLLGWRAVVLLMFAMKHQKQS
jgi:hypothetical protein